MAEGKKVTLRLQHFQHFELARKNAKNSPIFYYFCLQFEVLHWNADDFFKIIHTIYDYSVCIFYIYIYITLMACYLVKY